MTTTPHKGALRLSDLVRLGQQMTKAERRAGRERDAAEFKAACERAERSGNAMLALLQRNDLPVPADYSSDDFAAITEAQRAIK